MEHYTDRADYRWSKPLSTIHAQLRYSPPQGAINVKRAIAHFFLKPHEARAYRERNRRKRVAWRDLPEQTQRAVLAYLAD